ncbi:hypothetical protein J2N86_00745 [Legionella lytica]|uniref:Effector protein B, substrate of the Dot/Icm secretion system n=1 Tax=Legionella lytica TaxID=96232 RepID=A0ABY4Y9R9_9GAMM|nr:hypothetical protein [Legionella lytica]USQ13912.1 hypothetical protein J2N86_00745 [Legionella lytica]
MTPKKDKKDKKARQVGFNDVHTEIVQEVEPTAAVSRFVKNVYGNVRASTKDRSIRALAKQIYSEFTMYLDQLEQADFPALEFYENDATKIKYSDPRITTYCVLMKSLMTRDATLFLSSYQNNEIKFSVSGSPVSPENNSFALWGIFTRAAVAAVQEALPTADLTVWAVPMQNELDDIDSNSQDAEELSLVVPLFADELPPESELQESSSPSLSSLGVQDEQELSTNTSLLTKELVPEQEQMESISADSTSPTLHAEPQLTQEELDNYDFNAWQAPKELSALRASIKAMHTYGLRLKTACPQKANAAMQLAVELTNDLQNYYETAAEARNEEAFKNEFHTKLHSQDELMSTHRNYKMVVLANIAIALTGLGLAVIVVSLLVRGHGLYNSTQGQNKVNDIDQQLDKSLMVM